MFLVEGENPPVAPLSQVSNISLASCGFILFLSEIVINGSAFSSKKLEDSGS